MIVKNSHYKGFCIIENWSKNGYLFFSNTINSILLLNEKDCRVYIRALYYSCCMWFWKNDFLKSISGDSYFFENSVKSKKNLTERKLELSAELMLFLQFSMYFSPLPPQLRSEVCDFSVWNFKCRMQSLHFAHLLSIFRHSVQNF
jgi:hypothetical protein